MTLLARYPDSKKSHIWDYEQEMGGDAYLKQLKEASRCLYVLEKIDGKSPEFLKIHAYIDSVKKRELGDILKMHEYHAKQMRKELLKLYDEWMMKRTGSKVWDVYTSWREKILSKEFCFQGGFGHHISQPWKEYLPHHWVVKEDKYKEIIPSDEIELTFLILGKRWEISSTPSSEIWGN